MQTSIQHFQQFKSIVHGSRSMFSWVVLNNFDDLQDEQEEYCFQLWNEAMNIIISINLFKNAIDKNANNIDILRINIMNGIKRFILMLRPDHHTFVKGLHTDFYHGYDKLMDYSKMIQ